MRNADAPKLVNALDLALHTSNALHAILPLHDPYAPIGLPLLLIAGWGGLDQFGHAAQRAMTLHLLVLLLVIL